MTEIEHAVFGSENDGRLVLSSSGQASRKMSVGTNWTRLRVGLRMAMDDPGANLAGSPLLYFGLHSNPSSGVANGPIGATCSYFAGFKTVLATWTRVAAGWMYLSSSAGYSAGVKIGATWTQAATAWPWRMFSYAPNAKRALYIAEFLRSGGNLAVTAIGPLSQLVASTDIERSTLESALQSPTMAGALGIVKNEDANYGDMVAVNIPIDEGTNGPLNSICIAWVPSAVSFYVSEMLYSVIE